MATTFQCWECERRFPEEDLHQFGVSWGSAGRRSYSSRATLELCPECFRRQGRLSYLERLRVLVDNEDMDRVLSIVTLDQIADAWCRHRQRFGSAPDLPEAHEDGQGRWRWAVDLLQTRRWWEDENRARAGLVALVDRADADHLLEYVGAEALQTFLTANESDLRWIEEQAARSEEFRKALGSVQVFGRLPDEAALRVERAAGIRLARPGGWTGP